MTFYRTAISSIQARIANGLIAALAQPARLFPTTSRTCYKIPFLSSIPACMSESLCLLLGTFFCLSSELSTVFSPCRSNSPSTAAAPPLAAATAPVSCAKSVFFALLPQLSSPSAALSTHLCSTTLPDCNEQPRLLYRGSTFPHLPPSPQLPLYMAKIAFFIAFSANNILPFLSTQNFVLFCLLLGTRNFQLGTLFCLYFLLFTLYFFVLSSAKQMFSWRPAHEF
jgi:hypothetical protein